MPPHPAGPVDWKAHPFYKSAVVLGIDIGIEGIGLWLRKGPKPIFAHTFRVSLPVSAPLKKSPSKAGVKTRAQKSKTAGEEASGVDCSARIACAGEVDGEMEQSVGF